MAVENPKKKILLIDIDDVRRRTRVRMLEDAGYKVDLRVDSRAAEHLDHESGFDLVVVALHWDPEEAAAYSDRLKRKYVTLPILLLTDYGVFVPRGTLSKSIETGHPAELMAEIAEMLAGSKHVREL